MRHSGARASKPDLQGEPTVPSLFSSASRSRNRGRSPAPEYPTQLHRESRRAVDATGAEPARVTTAGRAAMAPKKRKSAAKTKTATKKKAASPKQPKKAASPKKKKGGALDFDVYADADEGVVTFEGLAQLADDLGIDPSSDTKLLAMCWRLGAEKPGCLSKEEWARFAENRHLPTYGKAQTVSVLKAGWNSLDPNFLDNGEFKPFFRFCFEFNREGTKRFLERDTALALLPLCVEDRSRHTQLFLEFLGTKPETKLNRDQWCSFSTLVWRSASRSSRAGTRRGGRDSIMFMGAPGEAQRVRGGNLPRTGI